MDARVETATPAPPSEVDRRFERRAGRLIGYFLSTGLHFFLLALLLWPELFRLSPAPSDGGWADEIELSASPRASDGPQGRALSPRPASSPEDEPTEMRITVVWSLPPVEPEPEIPPPRIDAPSDIPPPPVDKPREAPKPPDVAEAPPPSETPGEAPGDSPPAPRGEEPSEGGPGSRDDPAGAPAGQGEGRGEGRADPKDRPGTFLTGDQIAEKIQGWTLIGTEGAWDGSTPDNQRTRTAFKWEAYYDPNGTVEVRYQTFGAATPHGAVGVRERRDEGPYSIQGDLLCQNLEDLSYGLPVCFEVHAREGNRLAMYYVSCEGLTRCFPGRLGPEGIVVPGRAFTE